jgi:NAD(P)H-hydrate epimerase
MIPLFSTNQIREVDNFAIDKLGIPGLVLMENAALQIYNITLSKVELKEKNKIGFVCGKGNNGGDGFATARHFANNGFAVSVLFLGEEEELSSDCKVNFTILKNIAKENKNIFLKKYSSVKDLRVLSDCNVIFDAILGSGAKGELREPYKTIVQNINKINSFKVAIDIPTGLDSDFGYGEIIFNADLTITLAELKKGLFFESGFNSCGEVVKGNIGVSLSFFDRFEVNDYLIEPEDAFYSLPIKEKNIHKYSAGKVLIIAGSGALPGAAQMTALSALKIGAGAAVLAFPKSVRNLITKKLSEVVINSYEDEGSEFLKPKNISELKKKIQWADVIAIGPGLGRNEDTQLAVINILKEFKTKQFVIDADALFAIGKNNFKNLNLKDKVLTPHHAEFANLINVDINDLKKNILYFGKEFVYITGAYLVLKGAPTIVFTPKGEALINSAGNPGMAKFGTGDVLTGIIAGLIAQQKDLEKAVFGGVYLHSLAADLLVNDFTEFSYTAIDIINELPNAIKFLRKSFD